MVRLSYAVTLLAAAIGSCVAASSTTATVPGGYIVELETGADSAAFISSLGENITVRRKLNFKLYHGVSFRFNDLENVNDQAAQVAAMADVKSIHPITVQSIPSAHELRSPSSGLAGQFVKRQSGSDDSPDVWSTHVMTQVNKLRDANITGSGIKIALVDSGVDYTHPALGGCFGEGCIVTFGYDLVGDDPAYDTQNPDSVETPDADPMDTCLGHGTHVSGIIAAQDNAEYGVIGAATGVKLGMYKICDCYGYYSSDVIIAGFNMAYESGADIISTSVGNPGGWSEDPQAVAMQRIVDAGTPVIVSASNSGSRGLFYGATPAVGQGIAAAGSVDNSVLYQELTAANYSVDGGSNVSFGFTIGTPGAWANVTLPLYATTFDTSDTEDACSGLPASTPDLSNYIALIHTGTCSYQTKVNNVLAFGAKYIIFYNSGQGTITTSVNTAVAVAMVKETTGKEWVSLLESGAGVVVAMPDPNAAVSTISNDTNVLTPGYVATTSGWGPTFELELITTVTTPGEFILSLYPVAYGSYYVLSGTSMSAPFLAAVYALIMQATGIRDPATLRNMVTATANANLWNNGSATYSYLAPVPQQGAGLVQAYDAVHTTSFLSRSTISFNDTEHFIPTQNFTLSNKGNESVTYELGSVGAATAYTFANDSAITPMTFPNELVTAYATIAFSSASVTIAAGESEIIIVTATPPDSLDVGRLPVWSGYITVNGTDGSGLALPYMGVSGNMRDLTVLDAANTYVTSSTYATSSAVAGNYSFTLPPVGQASNSTYDDSVDLPKVFVTMAFGSRLVEVYVVSAVDNTVAGMFPTFPLTYQPRAHIIDDIGNQYNPTWDGSLADGTYMPAGSYKFLIKALHVFGDESVESDWDNVETVTFTVKYLSI